jgi:DHA2 family multidrug resistance protein-like MFS transporter
MENIAAPVAPTADKATRKQWIGLAVLALPTLLVSMDSTVTYLALPVISTTLHPTSSQLLWITDIFTFLEGGLLITMGTLGDRIGRKKLLLWGSVAFTLASVLAAFSQTAIMLIVARGLLGIAGATLLPSTVALIRSLFHNDRQRSVAMGIWTTCFATGTMLGPLVGGLLLSHFWWGSVFLIAVPLMLLFLVVGPAFLPEYRAPQAERFDLFSALFLLVGILSIIYAVKRLGEQVHGDWQPVAQAAGGIVLLVIFIRRQQRITNPLIDLKLFRLPAFNATLGALFLTLFCWGGTYLFVAQYLQLVIGLDPLHAGLWTIPNAAAGMISCLGAPWLARSLGRNTVLVLGMVILSAGILLLSQVNNHTGLSLLIPATILATAGCSFTVTLGVDKVISSVPHERAGGAAGIYETSTTFGSALGVGVLGSIGMAIYRSRMGAAHNSDIAADAIIKATNTLGEAVEVAQQLPGKPGVALLQESHAVFVRSFSITAGVAVALLLIMVTVVSWVYKKEARHAVPE